MRVIGDSRDRAQLEKANSRLGQHRERSLGSYVAYDSLLRMETPKGTRLMGSTRRSPQDRLAHVPQAQRVMRSIRDRWQHTM